MLNVYEEKFAALKEKGQVEIPLTDLDMEFFIEDSCKSQNLKYRKLPSPRNRYRSSKMLMFRLAK